jgi:hypothetical protein
MPVRISRRKAVATLAAAPFAFSIVPEGSARTYAANEKLDIALVGCGGRGSWFVDAVPRIGENLVALCDVNEQRAAETFGKLAGVPKFHDYRRMLEQNEQNIDAVIIAAPDHIHAPCGVMAMRLGKHLYCEKPLTNTVHEARVMRETARQTQVATQMGNQGTATAALREQVEIVRSGDLGEVREVYVWNADGGTGVRRVPEVPMAVPDYLKWNLWLGPRPGRPYHPMWMNWHSWREFGTGQLGNWAVHSANMAFLALRLDEFWNRGEKAPRATVRIRAEVSEIVRDTFPKWEIIHFDFPAIDGQAAVTLHWYNGLSAPRFRETLEPILERPLVAGGPGPWHDHAGCLLVGSRGKIHSTGHNSTYTLLPDEAFRDYQKPEPWLPRLGSHEREWLEACRGEPKAMSHFDYAAALTELLLLGNVATQFDRALEYDLVAMLCVGDEEATAALRRGYRQGWNIQG